MNCEYSDTKSVQDGVGDLLHDELDCEELSCWSL